MPSKIKIEYDAGTIVRAIRDLDQKIADTKDALKVLREAREEQIELLLATIEDPHLMRAIAEHIKEKILRSRNENTRL